MYPRLVIVCALLATGFGLAPAPASALQDEREAVAVLHKGRLIFLDEKGRFRVWSPQDGRFDEDASVRFARETVTHLASDGDKLWAAGKSALYSWSPDERSWKKLSEFEAGGEELAALIGVGGSPLLVFPSKVKNLASGRTFKVPRLKGQLEIDSLRILALHATDSMVWIGTGQGEWGGHLVGLNPRTGEWVQYYDEAHYVTGITQATPDEVIVSWSMSHFGANTLLRIHKLDATPKLRYPVLVSKYYQTIAFNRYDKTLYGVENTDVVSIREGKPSVIAGLEGPVFEREPMAIGASPGVSALLPIAQKTLIVVPKHGLPWKLADGALTRLRVP